MDGIRTASVNAGQPLRYNYFMVDINKLNTLAYVSRFIPAYYFSKDKQLSVKKHMLVQQLSFMLCGCL